MPIEVDRLTYFLARNEQLLLAECERTGVITDARYVCLQSFPFHSGLLTLEHIGRLVSSFICINEMKMQFKTSTTSSVLNMPFNVHVCCERGGAFNYHLRGRSQVNLTKIDD